MPEAVFESGNVVWHLYGMTSNWLHLDNSSGAAILVVPPDAALGPAKGFFHGSKDLPQPIQVPSCLARPLLPNPVKPNAHGTLSMPKARCWAASPRRWPAF